MSLAAALAIACALAIVTLRSGSAPLHSPLPESDRQSPAHVELGGAPSDDAELRRPVESGSALAGPVDEQDLPAPGIRVSTVTERFEPVPGAEVELWSGDRVVQRGRTDALGAFQLDPGQLDRPEALELCAHCEGYSHECVTLQRPSDPALTVVLFEEAVIHGTVREPGGDPTGRQASVVAWPFALRLPPSRPFEAACRGLPGRSWATTAADGSYRIRGLRRGAGYALLARAEGSATPARSGPITAEPEATHDLVLAPLYYLQLELREAASASRVMLAPQLEPGGGISFRVSTAVAKLLGSPKGASALLLGCRQATEDVEGRTILLTSPRDEADIGPIEATIALPGYEPWTGPLRARRLTDRIDPTIIHLRSSAGGFGSLVLQLPRTMCHAPSTEALPSGYLTLDAIGVDPIQFRVDAHARGVVELSGIPFGTYSCTIAGNQVGFLYPQPGEARVEVTIGRTPAQLRIPEEGPASLILDPRQPDDSPYSGVLVVDLLQGRPYGHSLKGFRAPGGDRYFSGPPYRVDLLKPGEYTIVAEQPRAIEPFTICTVASGEATRCVFHIP